MKAILALEDGAVVGTGGFLLGALEHRLKETNDGTDLTREQYEFLLKSGGVTPTRSDFNVTTSNKQLNFVQDVMSALENEGRAAMVAPDTVLFDAGEYEEPEVILESIKESEEKIIDEIDRIMEVVMGNEE